MTAAADRPPVRILTVCTGNICRSPYAALSLQHRLDLTRPGAFEVSSAGTHALVGQPVDPGSVALLAEHGVSAGGFRAAMLTEITVSAHDIVLVMTSQHRAHVIEEAPSAFRRVFTIKEFAHRLDVLSSSRSWPVLLATAGAEPGVRGRWRALPRILAVEGASIRRRERDQSVIDPYKRSERTFRKMAAELDAAIDHIVGWESRFAE